MVEYKGVLVYCETMDGKLAPIATELLGCGRKLADDLKGELSAVLIGDGISDIAPEVISYGADRVYVVDDPLLKDYQNDSYIQAMEKVVTTVSPQIVILGQTPLGRDLAPRLAFKLDTAATLDCVELAIDPGSGRLHQTKPVYGGNAQAVYVCNTDPQIVTVRSKAMTPLQPDTSRNGEIVKVEAGIDNAAIRTKVLERVAETTEGIKLEDAAVIVSGGRGIGSAEGFKQLAELAKLLKGAVGASRPPCDNGWVPDTLQIGLTGKIVAPELYVAVAMSGSSQHLSGCSGARTIVAINKDPEANIFKFAHFGVVGDWKQILPPLTEKVKELVTG
jgi:electron transfer flavoprotein alpha subunit